MSKIIKDRVTIKIEEDIVVFLIGIRINRLWKFWKWAPVFYAMPKMLIELGTNPKLGLLHARTHFGIRNTMVVQYWESEEKLNAYAKSRESVHLPAWAAFNKKIGFSGDVGVWHEQYSVPAGKLSNVYVNMPPHGLGRISPKHR